MRVVIFIVLILNISAVFGQTKNKHKNITPLPPPPSIESFDENNKHNVTHYQLNDRRAFYPFNLATQIKIVSFNNKIVDSTHSLFEISEIDKSLKSIELRYQVGLPILNDTITFSMIAQSASLTQNEVDLLSDILYNTCYKWDYVVASTAGCYNPHNAILFFNRNDEPFEYIEICFECNQLKYSNNNIMQLNACDFTYSELQDYFKLFGLKTNSIDFKNEQQLISE